MNIFREIKDIVARWKARFSDRPDATSLPLLIFVSVVVGFSLYGLFYQLAPWIWSFNLKVAPETIMPEIRHWLGQKDGIEVYALYVLMFVDLALTVLLAELIERLKLGRWPRVFWPIFLAMTFVVLIYFRRRIGFSPPMDERANWPVTLLVLAAMSAIMTLAALLAHWRRRWTDVLIAAALLPICLVASEPMSLFDYAYVFAPAWRLLEHPHFSDIYFQYDLLPSLLAAVWLKLNLALNWYPTVGRFALYALYIGVFFSARRFFADKRLAYWLLAAVVLVKSYAISSDPVAPFQVTPLRLDLWIILVILAWERGIYDKWFGVVFGLMLVFSRAFGLIYLMAYLELLAVLFLLDLLQRRFALVEFKLSVRRHLAIAWPNLVLAAIGWGLATLLFGRASLEAASNYQKLGIGFLPIYHQSFYWYVPIMLAVAFVILLRRRHQLGERYFQAGVFLILLTIGESLYFFGRSHEHNIINIAAILIYALFLLLDLALSEEVLGRPRLVRALKVAVPTLLVLTIAFYYAGRISGRVLVQVQNLVRGQLTYPLQLNVGPDPLAAVTGGSPKVYFLSDHDFAYDYAWGYAPQGRYLPYDAWVYKKDALPFLQGLLAQGYYLVVPEAELPIQSDVLAGLTYGHETMVGGLKVVWK